MFLYGIYAQGKCQKRIGQRSFVFPLRESVTRMKCVGLECLVLSAGYKSSLMYNPHDFNVFVGAGLKKWI